MSFPRYPKYKDSGVEWLGEVPEGWEVDRIKWSTTCCRNGIWGGEAQQDDGDIPCVRVADFDRERLRVVLDEPTIRNVPEKDRGGRQLHRGDLLLEKSGGGENQPVGCVVLYDDPTPAVCSNFVARVAVAEEMDSSFWRYVHAAAYAVRLNTRSIKQTSGIQNLDSSQYFDERSAFPPLPEQTAIAAFLDRETAKIDALVAEQRRLMELLKEKRQAVISHAVTKGLDPDAPMKSSGNQWLCDVPEHWEVKRLKHVKAEVANAFVDGPFGSNLKSEHFIEGGDVYVIESGFATQGKLDLNDLKTITREHFETINRSETRGGDIVIAKIGAQFGKSSILPDLEKPAVVSGNSLKLTVNQHVCDVRFVNWHLINLKALGVMDDIVNATAQPALSLGTMNNIPMLVPPRDEQMAIVRHLNQRLGEFDTLTAEAQRAIDLLQERRTALISAAVTGQIDVRGLAPALPTE